MAAFQAGFLDASLIPQLVPRLAGTRRGKSNRRYIASLLLILIAYCATQVLPAGAEYMAVFRFVSSVGFLAFGWVHIPVILAHVTAFE